MPAKLYFVVRQDQIQIDESTGSFTMGKGASKVGQTNPAVAYEEANKMAAHNPGTLVHILSSISVVEAPVPKVLMKTWKENGEFGT